MIRQLCLLITAIIAFSVGARADDQPARVLPEVPTGLREFVRLDWQGPPLEDGTSTLQLTFIGPSVDDLVCQETLKVKHVRAVNSRAVKNLTDRQVEILARFPELRWFQLSGNVVTDRCAVFLAASGDLEMIDLSGTDLTDVGIARLVDLKKLKMLSLRYTQVRGTDASQLHRFPALEFLDCGQTPCGGQICKEISQIKTLKVLILNDTMVTDESLEVVRNQPNLENLYLGNLPQLSIVGFRHAIQLPNLRILSLRDCEVDDAWLDLIATGSSIRELHLSNKGHYTLAAVVRLQKRNPAMVIYHERPEKRKKNAPQAVLAH